jgi:hypothetical protein
VNNLTNEEIDLVLMSQGLIETNHFLETSLNPYFFKMLKENLEKDDLYLPLMKLLIENQQIFDDENLRKKILSTLLVNALELEQKMKQPVSTIMQIKQILIAN